MKMDNIKQNIFLIFKSKHGCIWLIAIVTFVFALLTYISRYVLNIAPLYLDERIYLECGLRYVGGLPPILCNFEHPPLGKYIIGVFTEAGISMILLVFNYFLSLIFIYKITQLLTDDRTSSLYSTIVIGFDTLFMFTYMHFLLDPVALTFLLGTLYLGIRMIREHDSDGPRSKNVVILGILMGLTFATKWQTAYTLAGLILVAASYWARKLGLKETIRRTAQVAFISGATYLVTFLMDLKLGLTKPLEHNLMALTYMTYRHGFSFPLAVIGMMKLLSRVELWRLASFVVMYVTTTSVSPNTTSIIVLNSSTVMPSARAFLLIGIGVPSILWPILFPTFLIAVKARIERGLLKELDPLMIIAATSAINLLNGPLDWYYIYVIPFLYIVSMRYILLHRKGKYVGTVMVFIQVIQCLLFFSGAIPYAREISV